MFEDPYIRRKFKGTFITFDVTLSGSVLGNNSPLNQLPAIMKHFRENGCRTILDFGSGKNLRNANRFALDSSFDVYISEYEQLISHNLSLDQIKDSTKFTNALRQPQTPLAQYLHTSLTADTRQRLSKYNGTKPPTNILQQAIIDDLNSLLQRGSLYDKTRFATVRLTKRVQSMVEQDASERKKILRLNRLLLQEAYPDEIAECSPNLEKLLYPEELEHEPLEFDAILLSYVLHILPDRECRIEVLKACRERASDGAFLVVASPKFNTNSRAACSPADEYDIGWVKYNTDKHKHKAFYSEPDQKYLIKLAADAGFEYEGNWQQSTAKVLRFRKA